MNNELEAVLCQFRIAGRRAGRVFRNIAWQLKHGRLADDERFALRLARRHLEEGRRDLAEEDLAWLGKRMESRHAVRG